MKRQILFVLASLAWTATYSQDNFPVADAGENDTLNCIKREVTLNGTGSSQGPDFTYTWRSLDNNPIKEFDTPTPRINQPGVYELEVCNQVSGQCSTDRVNIAEDVETTVFRVRSRCNYRDGDGLFLDPVPGFTGDNYQYRWSAIEGGNIVRGETTNRPLVNQKGTYQVVVTNVDNGCRDTAIAILGARNLPIFVDRDTAILTCLDTVADIAITNYDENISYTWRAIEPESNQDAIERLSPQRARISAPGKYLVRGFNNLTSCDTFSNMITIREDIEKPFASAGPDDTLTCNQDTITLDGSNSTLGAGVIYAWSSPDEHPIGNSNSLNPEVTLPGSYNLKVTFARNGCFREAMAVVRENRRSPIDRVSPPALRTCRRPRIFLDPVPGFTGENIQYSWEAIEGGNIVSGQNTNRPLVDQEGTYQVVVTDFSNGCRDSAVAVVRDSFPTIIAKANPVRATLNCSDTVVTLSGTGSISNTGLTYLWGVDYANYPDSLEPPRPPNNPFSPIVEVSEPGIYYLLVEDPFTGCRDTLPNIIVELDSTVPQARIAVPMPITCDRPVIQLDALASVWGPNTSVEWISPDQHPIENDTTLRPSVSRPGQYILRISKDEETCFDETQVVVTIDTLPPVLGIRQVGILGCGDGTVSLNVWDTLEQLDSFSWVAVEGNLAGILDQAKVNTQEPGIYQLSARSMRNGCLATATTVVQDNPNPISAIGLTVQPIACQEPGSGAILVETVVGGEGPFLYGLNNGPLSTKPALTGLTAGSYEVMVEDSRGCRGVETAVLFEPKPIQVDLGPDQFVRLGDSLVLRPELSATTYRSIRWQPQSAFADPTAAMQVIQPLTNTLYRIIVESENGCISSDDLFVQVDRRADFYAPNAFSPNGDGINDRFRIYPGPQYRTIRRLLVVDRWGSVVYQLENADPAQAINGWDGTLDGEQLPLGVYLYMVELERLDGQLERKRGEVVIMR